MSNLRRQAAQALGDQLQAYLNLREPPAIIAAPPSEVAEYPRVAVWLEQFTRNYNDEEPEVDEDGELLLGAKARLSGGVGAAMIQKDVQLEIIGTMKGSGRIFVGCRLAPKREEVEDLIDEAFLQERGIPGRMVCTVQKPRVGPYTLPWSWDGFAFINSSSWTNEFAFSERLWAWIQFDLEISMLVARNQPMVKRFLLDTDIDFTQPAVNGVVVDLDDGSDTESATLTVPLE